MRIRIIQSRITSRINHITIPCDRNNNKNNKNKETCMLFVACEETYNQRETYRWKLGLTLQGEPLASSLVTRSKPEPASILYSEDCVIESKAHVLWDQMPVRNSNEGLKKWKKEKELNWNGIKFAMQAYLVSNLTEIYRDDLES